MYRFNGVATANSRTIRRDDVIGCCRLGDDRVNRSNSSRAFSARLTGSKPIYRTMFTSIALMDQRQHLWDCFKNGFAQFQFPLANKFLVFQWGFRIHWKHFGSRQFTSPGSTNIFECRSQIDVSLESFSSYQLGHSNLIADKGISHLFYLLHVSCNKRKTILY